MMNARRFNKRFFVASCLITMIGVMSFQAFAKEFPSKPITIIIPSSPGGGGDTSLRMLASKMEKHLGVPVVVKNLPGAGGVTGFTTFWRSKPDGYTLCMWYSQYAVSRQLFDKKVTYDVNKLEIVGQYVTAKAILGVPKDSAFRSVDDFKKAEKPVRFCTRHKTISFSVAAAALAKEMDFPITFVTGYKGSAASIVGAMRGEGDAVLFGAVMKRYIASDDLRGLLAFSRERFKLFPDIPTLKEKGISESLIYLSDLNYTVWAPQGTPQDRLKKVEEAMLKATKDLEREYEEKFFFPEPLPGQEAKALMGNVFKTFNQYRDLVVQN